MSLFTADDFRFMARALQLAERGRYTTDPNPRVGCVIVHGGEIVGEGYHQRAGEPHAEIYALQQAGERAAGATLYVTLEPCSHHGRTPPCADAVIAAGVARVVAAMVDPNPLVSGQGLARLAAAGIPVEEGCLAAEAERLNRGFVQRMRAGRPWLCCKLAASLDGRTAMESGESQWITGSAARADVQRLRAQSSAIITGVGTVLADDPSLTVRLEGEDSRQRQPLRVILDPRLSTPPTAKMLALPGATLIVTACRQGAPRQQLETAGAEVLLLPQGPDAIDLAALSGELARRGCNELLLESGATLSGAYLRAGLIDELILYLAPKLMGSQARPLFHTPGLELLADAPALKIDEITHLGSDIRIRAYLKRD
jgi:diaminohydroxyphosphoribosylaminopyrimidine deaminase / 5-amino-6-(5-phosphoribosylamino)uracil reductase